MPAAFDSLVGTRSVAFWAVIAALATSVAAAQPGALSNSRTLSIGGVGQQPEFNLAISAAGRIGTIVVNSATGVKVQTLSCDLFRDWGSEIGVDAATTARVIAYHAEHFVSGLKIADVDFDGLPDIMAVRDFGGKWVNYCVWLFDPNEGQFVQNSLSRQMEELGNLTIESRRRQIGPVRRIESYSAMVPS